MAEPPTTNATASTATETAEAYWQLEKDFFSLVPEGLNYDLIIRLIEYAPIKRQGDQGEVTESVTSKVVEFRVLREVLVKGSKEFEEKLRLQKDANGNKEKDASMIEIHEDSAVAFRIWMKILHATFDPASDDEDFIQNIGIQDLYFVLAMANKYSFSTTITSAKSWFEKWYAHHSSPSNTQANQQDPRSASSRHHGRNGYGFDYHAHSALLLPTYMFDHAPGFRAATKYLVYRATGQITARLPFGGSTTVSQLKKCYPHTNFGALILEPKILPQLNAAKTRLKTILHRGLWNQIADLLLRAACRCKPFVLFAYEVALTHAGVWPLEIAGLSNSIDFLLRKLENFGHGQNGQGVYQPLTCGSKACTFNFVDVVEKSRRECKMGFDGLCLDCMDQSTSEDEVKEQRFWQKAKGGAGWDQGCRVRHGQSSWYFSWLGDRAKLVAWIEEKKVSGPNAGRRRVGGHGDGVGQYGDQGRGP